MKTIIKYLMSLADLTVSEVYDFLRFFNVPCEIIEKLPSAGLFDGQSDETEMGISYKSIDKYLLGLEVEEHERQLISAYHLRSMHKREKPPAFGIS